MVREIIHDPFRLSIRSREATADDMQTAIDLLDTLRDNRERCVGMAANMIGVNCRIICFVNGNEYMTMFNPVIVSSGGPYETEEGCLSLAGTKKTKRYKVIKVKYCDTGFREKQCTFKGYTAQIIQHEIDHCNGILI